MYLWCIASKISVVTVTHTQVFLAVSLEAKNSIILAKLDCFKMCFVVLCPFKHKKKNKFKYTNFYN